ncbi:ATP-binding protein [Mariniplasma anaerobium]|uniref:UDP-N-acetylglucosamine kinase n=1 Tax=Mariniplasma anaerobium TaxID=2735436 RepID=A0A7U9THC3_9MOLU|nr:ATP-binding protein [Mariniplasma anaerobium]BCR35204.1 hypothetical protein MPAN_000970 [Mariniplasma anaerobium]
MKELIIMAGLPGSGKTYIRNKYFADYKAVDCDELKKTIKGYNPDQPRALHFESKIAEKYEIYNNLKNKVPFIYDTTATNTDKIIKLTKLAQALGYIVKIIYVQVSLATAFRRNSKRHRVVPDEIIMDKYSKLEISLKILNKFADKVITINNEKDEFNIIIAPIKFKQEAISA